MKFLAYLLLCTVYCFAADDDEFTVDNTCYNEDHKLGECKERNDCDTLNDEHKIDERSVSAKCGVGNICCPYGIDYDGIDDCGQSPAALEKNINGETALGEFPWTVAILKVVDDKKEYLGTGSLIRRNVVLTAAHILLNENGNLMIRAGVLDWNTTIQYSQDIFVNRTVLYPLYKEGPNIFDIGLVFLTSPVDITEYVTLVCLPEAEEEQRAYKNIFFSGWEKKNNFDDGVSMAMKKESNDGGISSLYVQVGLISWGIDCGMKVLPGGYTDVPRFINWINRKINESESSVNLQIKERSGTDESLSATRNDFSWSVIILRNTSELNDIESFEIFAAGSLIRPKLVLSVAHKFQDLTGDYKFKVRAGKNNVNEKSSYQYRDVEKVVTHSGYVYEVNHFNVALLFLTTSFNIEPNVAPISLPPQKFSAVNIDGCQFSGLELQNNITKKMHMLIMDRSKCEEEFRNSALSRYFNLHETFLCANIKDENMKPCKGIGGSSLVCPISENEEKPVLVGMISWAVDGGVEWPLAFVNVSYFMEWIEEKITNNK